MATIVNNPGTGNDSGGAAGWVVAVIVLLVVLVGAFLIWGRGGGTPSTTDVNVNLPSPSEVGGAVQNAVPTPSDDGTADQGSGDL